ncbi:MAG: FAD-dependent thymidylate synthase [Capsulimonadaceae bacterium]
MNVTQVAIRPSEASCAAGRPALTPELLAASGARYSRNNDGLEAILSRVDPANLDKSVDAIFKMIDYGHQSIADMVPVAIFIDGISIWLAYYLWSVCPTAGGQESSTRYLKMSPEDLVPPADLGIPPGEIAAWNGRMAASFDAYREALALWEDVARAQPDSVRIPPSVVSDSSERARKQEARMRRNFAFDRARYYIPAATATNVMMIMSARGWAQLCQYLISHSLPEAQTLGARLRDELALAAPRMLRHATLKESIRAGLTSEFARAQAAAACGPWACAEEAPNAHLAVLDDDPSFYAGDLAGHDNRYAWIGPSLQMTAVRFGWTAIALAEVRDLNRHRTGSKHCPFVPVGFYAAAGEIDRLSAPPRLHQLAATGRAATSTARQALAGGDPSYVYDTLLGTQFSFEHVTTADKFIYEAELRTGAGAHYRYARHLHDALELWYARYPATRDLILEGTAEPE